MFQVQQAAVDGPPQPERHLEGLEGPRGDVPAAGGHVHQPLQQHGARHVGQQGRLGWDIDVVGQSNRG